MATRTARTSVWRAAAAVVIAAGFGASGATLKFYPDDPIARVVDSQDASGVQDRDISLLYDTVENSVSWPGDHTPDVRART